jgi:heme exporter protein A
VPRDAAIEADEIGKRFGSRWALRGASCRIERGEVVGLLGANGSGKSTLLRVLATLLRPTRGEGFVAGLSVTTQAPVARREIGFLAHAPGLYDDLTARENLEFAADMLGLTDHAGVDAALERAGLGPFAHERVRGFSAGMQRRLALARLTLARPAVLLCDEPYSNLDNDGVALMNRTIGDLVSNGAAALIALHETAPAASLLSRTIRLVDGTFA